MTDHNRQAVARKVRERREQLGLSVRQAAAQAGVTRATWTDVETGKRDHIRVRTLDSIDRALRFRPGTLADLMGVTTTDAPSGERRITVVLEVKPGDEAEHLNAREQLVSYATSLSNYDVQRVLTYIDRLPPPPDIDRFVREAVERTLAELLTAGGNLDAVRDLIAAQPHAAKSAHRKVS
jgi:transcriptional regulator with XRE-family HTH domain